MSFAAIDILSEGLGINVRLFPFQIPSFGALVEDRIGIARAVQGDLERRGLARAGNVDPDVLSSLRLIAADFQVSVAVLGTVDGGREIYARAAATGRMGVLARQEQQGLYFDVIRPEAIARAVVSLLPAARPGPGQSVTITQQATVPARHRRDSEDEGFAQPVRATRSMSDAQLHFAGEILRRPRKGGGYFVVSGRGQGGKEITAPGLSWIDTEDGRYLVQVRDGADGQTHSTFAPADEGRLAHQLNDLLRSVSG